VVSLISDQRKKKKKLKLESVQDDSEANMSQIGRSGSPSRIPLLQSSLSVKSFGKDGSVDGMDIGEFERSKGVESSRPSGDIEAPQAKRERHRHSDVFHSESDVSSSQEVEDTPLIDSRYKRRAESAQGHNKAQSSGKEIEISSSSSAAVSDSDSDSDKKIEDKKKVHKASMDENVDNELDLEGNTRSMDKMEGVGGSGDSPITIDHEESTTGKTKKRRGRPRGSGKKRGAAHKGEKEA
jgi:hypothetical protein